MSDAGSNVEEVPQDEVVEEVQAGGAEEAKGGAMSVEDALQEVLKVSHSEAKRSA